MPIDISELDQPFIVVDEQTTVGAVRMQIAATKSPWTVIVIHLANGQYVALKLPQLMEIVLAAPAATSQEALLALPLNAVAPALAPLASTAVEQASMGTTAARTLRNTLPNHCLVVLQHGTVLGVMGWVERGAVLGHPAEDAFNRLPATAPIAAPGTLSLDDDTASLPFGSPAAPSPSLPSAQPPPLVGSSAPAPPTLPEQRFVNVEIEDHVPAQPLQAEQDYTLALYVDTQVSASAVVDVIFKPKFDAPVELTVQLASDDFEIMTEPQKLRVPPTGRSANKARFDFKTKQPGTGQITAVLFKDNNVIQVIIIKLQVGVTAATPMVTTPAVGTPQAFGDSLASAQTVKPRDVSLTFFEQGGNFSLIFTGAVYSQAPIPLTYNQLDQMVAEARATMQKVVYLTGGSPASQVYLNQLDIPPEVNKRALGMLSEAGFNLYRQLFFGPAAGADLKQIGQQLRKMAQADKAQLKIKITSQHFLLPWGMLYMADKYDPDNIDPTLFLGLKHIIEHIPFQSVSSDCPPLTEIIDTSQPLTVSLNVNTSIDQAMNRPFIANQLTYWDTIKASGKVDVIIRKSELDVRKALADTTTPDHILYFNCHAVSKGLSDGGPDASMLVLTTKEAGLTLHDLNIYAGSDDLLPHAPLVFINACESAELSPMFYDGFVPYFMSKGARGVVGTECDTPAFFAVEFAKRFFDAFLTGKPLGQVFLELRREFYFQHNNIMGLLYALYCNGDTKLDPALQIAIASA